MKQFLPIHLVLASILLAGCQRNCRYNEVVKETYIHKYGTPIAKGDWEKQGGDGQVVSLHSDGVTVTTSYAKGVVHGPTYYSYPNSTTHQMIYTYAYGELVSKKENYPSGVPMKEEIFDKNMLVELNRWYEDGSPQAHELYQDERLTQGEYRTPLNVVEARVVEGKGLRICRSPEGDLLSQDTMQDGQLLERVTYYISGDPSTVTPYKDGMIHGARLTFHQGGLPNTVEQWMEGMQEGITTLYQNGEKIAEIPYVQGKKQGVERRFRDGTLLVEEVCWQDDVQHGPRKLYIDGEARTEWYHEGEVVSRTTFERLNLPHRA